MIGYFDLYTTTSQSMNIYSKLFANRLGFRTKNIANRSVHYIDRVYRYFEHLQDRAGQHHALVMAMTMFNRARWSKKIEEAHLFKEWIVDHMDIEEVESLHKHRAKISSTQKRIPARH